MDINTKEIMELVDALLGPKGCPWGKAQPAETLCLHIIEESYEVIDAIRENDPSKIEEELGDVLFSALFTLAVACKKYGFESDQLIDVINQKIKRRHPHVFENPRPLSFEQLRVQWEEIKAKERADKNEVLKEDLFSCVARSLPLVTRAVKHIDLGVSKGFEYQPDENNLGGRFLKLVIDGLNEHKHVERIFEDSLLDYQEKFNEWEKKEKAGDCPIT